MHSQTGIVAGLALIIVILTADPAAADPVLPLPVVSIDLLPDRNPHTTTATTAPPATTQTPSPKPASAKPIKTTTREQHAVRTNGGGTNGVAQHEKATQTPSPKPTLRPAAPEPPREAAGPNDNMVGRRDRWFDLAALALVALVAAAFMPWRPRSPRPRTTPPRGIPPCIDPETAVDALLVEVYRDGYGDGYVDCTTLK